MKRIAVVEDEVYMREELCNMLQKDGYLAEAITELEDAVRLLAALRPEMCIRDRDNSVPQRDGNGGIQGRSGNS